MNKHLLLTFVITLALITPACKVPSISRGPQPGQPPQQLEQPGGPGQQPEEQPGQPRQELGQPRQSGQQPGQPPNGQGPASPAGILIDQTVNIPGGGGSAEIAFDIGDGQWTHIQLTGGNPGMQPYGSLQYPDGATVDSPPINTTANGGNQVDVLLNQNGRYTLTLFDGSNHGGPVSVKIISMP